MRLTETQKKRIAAYLRDIAWDMGDAPDAVRRARLRQLNQQLAGELRNLHSPAPSDYQVEQVLERCRPADLTAAGTVLDEDAVEAIAAAPGKLQNRIWLGVCQVLANEGRLEPFYVRLVFVLLGITGPFAILAYLGAFAVLRYTGHLDELPPVRWNAVLSFTASIAAVATALYAGTRLLLYGLSLAYDRFLGGTPQTIDRWSWALDHMTRHYVWVLITLLPLAVLGSLPLTNGWDATLRKVVKAALAVYALVLSIAVATAVAGAVLGAVDELF